MEFPGGIFWSAELNTGIIGLILDRSISDASVAGLALMLIAAAVTLGKLWGAESPRFP